MKAYILHYKVNQKFRVQKIVGVESNFHSSILIQVKWQ